MERGTRLGHYEILEPLGAGGMGEVYRARDSKLDRDVAIKVLPADFATDQDRLARFEREAKLLAALNHANIASIYGFEDADGVRFIAMELVDGETLADRIAADGRIEIGAALEIAWQIAEAIGSAHEAGIVHRDLKPANVKVTPEGKVKVLDFGLAKAYGADGSASDTAPDSSHSPTVLAATEAGVILGTAPYMSPEQARGKPVDRRTDIWAFGCVLFEMLSGKRTFEGATVSDTLAAVLRADPAFDDLPSATPGQVRRLLRRALVKDRRRRLQHIGDARVELEEALATPEPGLAETAGGAAITRGSMAGSAWLAGLALAAGIAIGAVATLQMRPANGSAGPTEATRLSVNADLSRRGRFNFAISPDGRTLVYAGERGNLFVRRLGEFESRPLAGIDGAQTPFFSPDGEWIGYWADGAIHRVSPDGGAALRIAAASPLVGASWTADNRIVFAEFVSPLRIVSAQGGEAHDLLQRQVDANDTTHVAPHVLPGDVGVLFETETRIAVASLATGEWEFLLDDATVPAYSPSGHLVYRRRDETVWAVPFDLDALQITGAPFPAQPQPVTDFKIAADGTFVFHLLQAGDNHQLVWVDRSRETEELPVDAAPYQHPRLSPDGRQIAVTIRGEIWTLDIARGTRTRFAGDGVSNRWPVWTHGGSRITFTSTVNDSEPLNLFWRALGSTAQPERLIADNAIAIPISWSEPTQELAFYGMDGPHADIKAVAADGTVKDLIVTPYDERSPMFSPDGRRLAYISNESGRDEIYIVPYPELEPRILVSRDGGIEPVWARDGSELYYRDDTGMMAVPLPDGERLEPGAPELLFANDELLFSPISRGNANYDVGTDGRFLMVQAADDTTGQGLRVVLGWAQELQRRAIDR